MILGGVSAQDHSYTLTYPVCYYALPYRTMDTVSSKSSDSLWYMQYYLDRFAFPVKVNAKIHLHKLAGSARSAISLQGKQFSGDDWINITTVNYGGAGDTTFTITDGTARQYMYYRVLLDKVYSVTGRTGVQTLEFHAWQTQ